MKRDVRAKGCVNICSRGVDAGRSDPPTRWTVGALSGMVLLKSGGGASPHVGSSRFVLGQYSIESGRTIGTRRCSLPPLLRSALRPHLLARPGGSQWNTLSRNSTMTAGCVRGCGIRCGRATRAVGKFVAARIFLQTDLPLSKGTALDLPVEMPEQVRR